MWGKKTVGWGGKRKGKVMGGKGREGVEKTE